MQDTAASLVGRAGDPQFIKAVLAATLSKVQLHVKPSQHKKEGATNPGVQLLLDDGRVLTDANAICRFLGD